jgi:hypothetical protein
MMLVTAKTNRQSHFGSSLRVAFLIQMTCSANAEEYFVALFLEEGLQPIQS